ncbi:MAG: GNAT family N-acetyltransferase [Alphaproteobacteria bacterium]|nr:GNAT family N-acetyltransferase [Alphaproteobacteria bacterium]
MNKKHLIVKKLDSTNLKDVMSLQQKIINGLHPDEQHFILHRTEADYMKSLNGTSSNMLGVFDNGELIAQTVYGTPQNNEPRDMPEFKSDTPNENLVIFEAILVDPAYRGSSLMKRMLEYIEQNAIDSGRTHSIIQIAVDNPASWINALHYGMSITKVDLDPSDGAKVIYLEKKIEKNKTQAPLTQDNNRTYSMYLGENIHKKIPSLFMKMQYLIAQGYQGISLNKETQSLIWQQKGEEKTKIANFNLMIQQKKAKTAFL